MGIEVSGKNCKLWISHHKGSNGNEWDSYSVGVSRKDQDGQYINAYQDVAFTRNAGMNENVKNGTTFDFEGWMSVKVYKDREGKEVRKPVITINKTNLDSIADEELPDSFDQLDEDVPF